MSNKTLSKENKPYLLIRSISLRARTDPEIAHFPFSAAIVDIYAVACCF
ncbi:hypothetical protein [Avibacterium avium]